jgi:hypothetical protein
LQRWALQARQLYWAPLHQKVLLALLVLPTQLRRWMQLPAVPFPRPGVALSPATSAHLSLPAVGPLLQHLLHQAALLLLWLLVLWMQQVSHSPHWLWVTWAWTQTPVTMRVPLVLPTPPPLLLPGRLTLVLLLAQLAMEAAQQQLRVRPEAEAQPWCCCCCCCCCYL